MYLIMSNEDFDRWLTKELTQKDKGACNVGLIEIINLEDLTFYAENDVWQKIPEK